MKQLKSLKLDVTAENDFVLLSSYQLLHACSLVSRHSPFSVVDSHFVWCKLLIRTCVKIYFLWYRLCRIRFSAMRGLLFSNVKIRLQLADGDKNSTVHGVLPTAVCQSIKPNCQAPAQRLAATEFRHRCGSGSMCG